MNELKALGFNSGETRDASCETRDASCETRDASCETRDASCETHGAYVSKHIFRTIWSQCPVCAEQARLEKESEDARQAAAERAKAFDKRLGYAGIPERFKTRTLESFCAETPEQKRALQFAVQYAGAFDEVLKSGKSAIFCGRPGTGKTHLAIGIAVEVIKRNRTAAFSTVQRLVRRVKDSWRNDSEESESDVIAMYADVDLLILDEVGVQFGTEFEKNLLFDVLNERYEHCKPTLLLSNLVIDEVKQFLGERVFDRLREGGGRAIPFTWESHRG